jgi:hypothetical protein
MERYGNGIQLARAHRRSRSSKLCAYILRAVAGKSSVSVAGG